MNVIVCPALARVGGQAFSAQTLQQPVQRITVAIVPETRRSMYDELSFGRKHTPYFAETRTEFRAREVFDDIQHENAIKRVCLERQGDRGGSPEPVPQPLPILKIPTHDPCQFEAFWCVVDATPSCSCLHTLAPHLP